MTKATVWTLPATQTRAALSVLRVRENAHLYCDGYLLIANDLPVANFSHPSLAIDYAWREWGLSVDDVLGVE